VKGGLNDPRVGWHPLTHVSVGFPPQRPGGGKPTPALAFCYLDRSKSRMIIADVEIHQQ
jgi:hypothetical protein